MNPIYSAMRKPVCIVFEWRWWLMMFWRQEKLKINQLWLFFRNSMIELTLSETPYVFPKKSTFESFRKTLSMAYRLYVRTLRVRELNFSSALVHRKARYCQTYCHAWRVIPSIYSGLPIMGRPKSEILTSDYNFRTSTRCGYFFPIAFAAIMVWRAIFQNYIDWNLTIIITCGSKSG